MLIDNAAAIGGCIVELTAESIQCDVPEIRLNTPYYSVNRIGAAGLSVRRFGTISRCFQITENQSA